MKNKKSLTSVLFLIFPVILGACRFQPVAPPSPELTRQPKVTLSPTPLHVEPANNYRELTEEELASLIHTNIIEIEAAAKTAANATTQFLSDNILTDAELSKTLSAMYAQQTAIDTTGELINIFMDQYGELAPKTVDLLIAIDQGLQEIATNSSEIITHLEKDKNTTVAIITSIAEQSSNIQMQSSVWHLNVEIQIEEREKLYANTASQPSQVTYNRVDAFTQAHDFLDATTIALNDKKISSAELAIISQLAANAKASLYNTGDPELIGFAQQINKLAHTAYRGEWTQTSNGIAELKQLLPARPRPL